jgi:hypothetical protein
MTSKLNVNGSRVHSSDRAALVERALQAATLSAYEKGNNLQLSTEDLAAALDLIRAEVLEEAAGVAGRLLGNYDTMDTIPAAIRALKGESK